MVLFKVRDIPASVRAILHEPNAIHKILQNKIANPNRVNNPNLVRVRIRHKLLVRLQLLNNRSNRLQHLPPTPHPLPPHKMLPDRTNPAHNPQPVPPNPPKYRLHRNNPSHPRHHRQSSCFRYCVFYCCGVASTCLLCFGVLACA